MSSHSSRYQMMYESPVKGRSFRWRKFMIKLRHWEYWPIYVFNIPVVFIWLWNAIKSRDLFFFTLTNPGIPTGGFFGESKSEILKHLPDNVKPKTVLWQAPVPEEVIENRFVQSGLTFPIIIKPEVGERGWLISRINTMQELNDHIQAHPIDLIIQPFIDLPMEVSIMVFKLPDDSQSKVTSICLKEFLHVTGDGRSTIEQLILLQDRALLHYEKLRTKLGPRMLEILPKGETLILEQIGNHCRGTKFINRNDQIDNSIREVMVGILSKMPDVYYGRFDMKMISWEQLREGKGIQVMEFNGTSSDPAHIYDPGYSIFKAYRDIFYHWGIMAKIARQNRRAGMKPVPLKEIISALIIYFRYKRTN